MLNRSQWTARGLLVALTLVAAGCADEASTAAPPPQAVTVAAPVLRDVTEYYYYTGTTEAVEDVQIRARVSGQLESVHFEPSTDIEKDVLLFRIEPAPYEAAARAAEAEVARSKAVRDSARSQFERVQSAFERNAASDVERIRAEAEWRETEANVKAAEARLDQAQIDLGYTEVRSPIAGRIGRKLVSIGDLVGYGEQTLLTTIVQLDPIWVYVDVSERIVLEYLQRGRDGRIDPERDVVELALADTPEGEYPFNGVIDFVDNRVDESTGTIRVRGRFDNPDRKLFPGLFARVRVPFDKIPDAVLVEQNAVGADLTGKYVYVVDDTDTVQLRRIELGPRDGAHVVVRRGLEPGERYVVAGVQKVRAGQKVNPQPADATERPAPAPEPDATPEAAGAPAEPDSAQQEADGR